MKEGRNFKMQRGEEKYQARGEGAFQDKVPNVSSMAGPQSTWMGIMSKTGKYKSSRPKRALMPNKRAYI